MIAGLISGLFGLLLAIIGGLISLALFIFWVVMLIHALTNRGLQGVLPVIGSLIYFFVGRKQGVLT